MPTFVCGDVHGCLAPLLALLRREALLDGRDRWSGGEVHLWFLGDYMDRGPDGVGVLDLVMRLQAESRQDGGFVGALLGNHDVIALNAARFGDLDVPGLLHQGRAMSFRDLWLRHARGQASDAERLRPRHLDWLAGLPALAVVGDALLMHADSTFYRDHGESVPEINAAVAALLAGDDAGERDRFEERFARRREFLGHVVGEDVAAENVKAMLALGGARRLVHGHTPVHEVRERPADEVHEAWRYGGGRCVNVDPALYAGGEGFLFRLD